MTDIADPGFSNPTFISVTYKGPWNIIQTTRTSRILSCCLEVWLIVVETTQPVKPVKHGQDKTLNVTPPQPHEQYVVACACHPSTRDRHKPGDCWLIDARHHDKKICLNKITGLATEKWHSGLNSHLHMSIFTIHTYM